MPPPDDSPAAYLDERPLFTRVQVRFLGIVAPLLIAFPLALLPRLHVIQSLEGHTIDQRFRARGPRSTQTRIVVVEIGKSDRMTLREGANAFNLRQHLATAIDRLADAGALAIGVDFWLEGLTNDDIDEPLARSIAQAPVVLALTHTEGMVERAPAMFRSEYTTEGVITVYPDAGGNVLRRLPANLYLDLLSDDGAAGEMQRVWHLPVAMAWFATVQQDPDAGVAMVDGRARVGPHAVQPRGLIDWVFVDTQAAAPPPGWTVLRLADVVNGAFDADRVDGALVLMAEARTIADAHRTPLSDRHVPGVYYHANAVAHILDDRSFDEAWSSPARQWWLTGGLALAAGLYGWMILPWWRYRRGGLLLANYMLGGIALFPGGWTIVSAWMFRHGVLLPMAAPLAAMSLALTAGLAGQWIILGVHARRLAERARRIEALFGRSVSPSVLDAIRRQPQRIAGIQTRDVTVLFGDLRNFTALTAEMPPARVADMLNEYYDYVTAAVFRQEGFLDKFVGDEIMAVFSVPFEQADHAERAVQAALDIKRRLAALNAARAQRGEPPLDCGLGIHCGQAAAGHIGSRDRSNYTVVGATVNQAARIEKLTRRGEILISDAVRRQLSSGVQARHWGRVEIRGLSGMHDVYEVVTDNETAPVDGASGASSGSTTSLLSTGSARRVAEEGSVRSGES